MVSIIVPVYRTGEKLRFCIESLIHQEYEDIEIILIDDGSPDNSGFLCDEYAGKDQRIKVVHKENGGVSAARNTGMELAGGEYILFVDSDDYAECDYVSTLIKAAQTKPDTGHIWCCFQTVAGYNYEDRKVNCKISEDTVEYQREDIMTLHEKWLDTPLWNKLYRADVINECVLRFDETLSLGEDWMFNLEYLNACKRTNILVVSKPLYNYVRAEGDSLDSKYREDMLDIYRKLNSKCEAYLLRWGVSDEQMQIFYNSCFYSYDKVLRNTFFSSDMSRRDMYKYNNSLMKSREFRDTLAKTICYIHPLYRRAYEMGNYRMIRAMDWIHKIVYPESRQK